MGGISEATLSNEVKFTQITSISAIYELLQSAKDFTSDVFIWRLLAGEEHLGHVRVESLNKTRKDFTIVSHSLHEKIVQNLLLNQSTIDFYIPNSSLLFRCHIKSSEGGQRYTFHFPVEISQVDRRSTSRINTHQEEDLGIQFLAKSERGVSQQFLKKCFDMSAGGLSFYTSRMEQKFFQDGSLISEMKIKTEKWATKVDAEVVMIKEMEPNEFNGIPYKVWRVCCRFKGLDDLHKQQLNRYILQKIKDELHAINA